MTTKPPFISTSYGGYYEAGIPKEDEELTHTGPRTHHAGSICVDFGSLLPSLVN